MDRFDILEVLGSGTFSTVYKVIDKKDKKTYALKVCIQADDQEDISNLLAEALILSKVKNENVITCFEILFDKGKIIYKLELLTSDLDEMIKKRHFTDNLLKIAIKQITNGMKYLHNTFGIYHCDLKPKNILYDEEKQVLKIGDFNSIKIGKIHDTSGCTRWYRAPESELIDEYTIKSDVWSLACIFYEMITKKVLFPSNTEEEHLEIIVKKVGTQDNKQLIKKYGIKKGSTFPLVKNKKYVELLTHMLKINPCERFTLAEILAFLG